MPTHRASKIHGGEWSEVIPSQEHPKNSSKATYRSLCRVSITEKTPLETYWSISPNFITSEKTFKCVNIYHSMHRSWSKTIDIKIWNTDRWDVRGRYLRKYFRDNKTRTNTAKKEGLYFILFSVLNSEVSLGNLMLFATKYFVLVFRNWLNYIVRFTSRKKLVWKSFDFIAKSAKFRAFQKGLGKKINFFYDNSWNPKGLVLLFLLFSFNNSRMHN